MDKENGLFFVPDGFTPASTNFNELQRASTGFMTILGFYMMLFSHTQNLFLHPHFFKQEALSEQSFSNFKMQ
jgi:hypothetical protein